MTVIDPVPPKRYTGLRPTGLVLFGVVAVVGKGWESCSPLVNVGRPNTERNGEDAAVTEKHEENQHEVERAMKIIDHLNKLHDQVTKGMTNPDQCIIGFILHTNYWESVTGEVHLNTVKTSLTRTTVY